MFCLLGGTFDPIHLGHLHLAVQLADRYRFQEVGFVPARQNPLKTRAPGATAPQRLEMVRLALADLGDPRLRLLDWEITSPAPSYTVNTVQRAHDTGYRDVALVVGNEVFAGLAEWQEPKRLLSLCNVVIATRSAVDDAAIELVLASVGVKATKQGSRWSHDGGHWVEVAPITPLAYSATGIREAWFQYWKKGGGSVLPQGTSSSVAAFIKRNRLYAVK